jgi:hypothetical protein
MYVYVEFDAWYSVLMHNVRATFAFVLLAPNLARLWPRGVLTDASLCIKRLNDYVAS